MFLAGGSLTALIRIEEGSLLDIRLIAVGEINGKCLRIISRVKASGFFWPLSAWCGLPSRAEKLVQGLCRCISEHWVDDDFIACKIDLSNAFNEISGPTSQNFSDGFCLCYGQHPTLWHSVGTLSSEQGVQQWNPLGPILFSLVLHKLVRSIASDSE